MRASFVSPFLMWLIAGSGAIFLLLFAPSFLIFGQSAWQAFVFALVFQLWLGFYALGLWQNRRAAQSAGEVKKLITSGVYSIVRHPIYSVDILMAWGVFLVFPGLNVLLAASWITYVLHSWMGFEEEALKAKFGRKYADYSKKVPKFIPRI
jgi:protein-S-isoprenylcysteine O-methyltransferase Ste14